MVKIDIKMIDRYLVFNSFIIKIKKIYIGTILFEN